MRVAIVSQFSSAGGGARFLRRLCGGLLDQAEIAEIGLFIDSGAAARDGMLSLGQPSQRLTLHLMDDRGDLMDPTARTARDIERRLRAWARRQPAVVGSYRMLRRRVFPAAQVAELRRITLSERVVAAISGYDVAYFPWPRLVVPPPEPRALVATFHDFNHRHGFGNFRPREIELLDAEMVEWLTGRVRPITSTQFIADELNTYYPARAHEPEVVYLSTLAVHDPDPDEVATVVAHFGLPEGYVLCPTNVSPHKNVVTLLRAVSQMKRSGVSVPLVLTGSGTHYLGIDPSSELRNATTVKESIDELHATIADADLRVGEDIWPLGYVSDAQMDALVRGAALVAAPSLYEAGSGPALDAWWLGTPVASSALHPVVEQMKFLGTEAALFDPTDVGEMAAALTAALTDRQRTNAMAKRSQVAIARYTWDDVASDYVRVFHKALAASTEMHGGHRDPAGRERGRQNLLWLTVEPPWPASSGGRLRTAALLSAAAERYGITLVVLYGDQPADPGPFADLEWVTCGADTVGKAATLSSLAVHRRPPYLRHFATSRQRQVVQRWLAARDYAAIVADTPYAAAALPHRQLRSPRHVAGSPYSAGCAVVGLSRPALIVNTQNVEAEAWQAATAHVAGGRLLLTLDRRFMDGWERQTLARADGVAFCSERDRASLCKALTEGVRTAIVPNAVDTATMRPLDPPAAHTEALFLGGLTYGPNLEAARFIVERLAPRLEASGISVLIAGGEPSDLASGAQAPAVSSPSSCNEVRFLGRPLDVRPLYQRSYATIVPLFSGSGTRLKVLESFAYGRPVVSTAKGVEGLAVEPDKHYLPAETAEQFADQLVRLRDPNLRKSLVREARLLVEQRYSWQVAGAAFLALLDETLGQA